MCICVCGVGPVLCDAGGKMYSESEYGGSWVVGLSREVDFWESQYYG